MIASTRSLKMPTDRLLVIVLSLLCVLALSCALPHHDASTEGAATTGTPLFELISGTAVTEDAASTGGVSWVDFDGDGDIDLMVTNGYDVSVEDPEPQKNRLYENRGGQLESWTSGPLVTDDGFSSGSTWADFDNDGLSDVFISNQRDQNNFLYQNMGDGVFARIEDQPPANDGGQSYAASWVDVDNDGWLDLFVANGGLSHQGKNFLYRNLEGQGFERIEEGEIVTEEGTTCGVSWADFDGDGDQDVFVSDMMRANSGTGGLYRNDGDWTFSRLEADLVPLGESMPTAAAWGDIDNDGDLDLYLAAVYGMANVLLRNNGADGFARVGGCDAALDGGHSYGANWADIDNDGDLDLVVANWGAAPVIYTNDGTGLLDRAEGGALGSTIEYPATIAWADLDADGSLDLALGNWPNAPGAGELNRIYRNRGSNGHWLMVKLEGTTSNRSAIGARIIAWATIDGKPTMIVREVSAHTGWRSQNELTQHLGLGDADTVDKLVVNWPSGAISRLENLAVDRVVEIEETP
jgi:hypothetical protein